MLTSQNLNIYYLIYRPLVIITTMRKSASNRITF